MISVSAIESFGMRVHTNPDLLETYYPHPKTKRKRVRKKWRQHRFKQRPSREIYRTTMGLICHPATLDALRKSMAANQEELHLENMNKCFGVEEHRGFIS